MQEEKINILNENGEIIGEATREETHARGLLHPVVHVWFVTPDRKLIFQRRGKHVASNPDLLDATVGGHVEKGETYEMAAIKETFEETGVKLNPSDLIYITAAQRKVHDSMTHTRVYHRREVFTYPFKGALEGLKIEEGKGEGFELFTKEALLALSSDEKKRFVPFMVEEALLVLEEMGSS